MRPRRIRQPQNTRNIKAAKTDTPNSHGSSIPIRRPPYETSPSTAPAAKQGMHKASATITAFTSRRSRRARTIPSCPFAECIVTHVLKNQPPGKRKVQISSHSKNAEDNHLTAEYEPCFTDG